MGKYAGVYGINISSLITTISNRIGATIAAPTDISLSSIVQNINMQLIPVDIIPSRWPLGGPNFSVPYNTVGSIYVCLLYTSTAIPSKGCAGAKRRPASSIISRNIRSY